MLLCQRWRPILWRTNSSKATNCASELSPQLWPVLLQASTSQRELSGRTHSAICPVRPTLVPGFEPHLLKQSPTGDRFPASNLTGRCLNDFVALHFIERGKPTQNAFIESFNGKFRDECLNQNWFVDLREAQDRIEAWRVDYNTVRPYSLRYLMPEEFAATAAERPASPPRRSLPPPRCGQDRVCRSPQSATL